MKNNGCGRMTKLLGLDYSGMVFADQGANLIFMVSTMGTGTALGLGVRGAMAVASTGIGVSSAGQKRNDLEMSIAAVPDALEGLEINEQHFANGNISEEQYTETKTTTR
jgi:hypothetical protein